MIINLRGTNGSGKSTAARSMLKHRPPLHPSVTGKWTVDDVEAWGYNIRLADVPCLTDGLTVLIGSYPEGKTGGCDRVKTYDLMRAAISAGVAKGYQLIIFESVTVSTVFGSWADFCAMEHPFTWAYLDTPVDICLERVRHRNGGKEFNEQMVVDKYRAIESTREKAYAAGFDVQTLRWENASAELNALASMGT